MVHNQIKNCQNQGNLRLMERKLLPIYSYNMTLTESEFLAREFKLKLTEINLSIEKKLKQKKLFLLATCDPKEIETLLKNCQDKSVILFFLGNETYDVPQTMWMNKYSNKIKHCFIYNLPRRTSYLVTIRCLFGAIYDGGIYNWRRDRNILRNFKNGIDLMKRTRKLRLNFSYSDFPQGYSKRFVKELSLYMKNLRKDSIVNVAPLNLSRKVEKISFVGQSGSWCREVAINTLCKLDKNFKPTFTIGWGGSNQGNQIPYLDALSKSVFSLNPPGNLTNRTHRYLESLIMNTLPVQPPATLQDPHHWGVWSEFEKPRKYSWKKNIKSALKMKNEKHKKIVLAALYREKNRIRQINNDLNLLLN